MNLYYSYLYLCTCTCTSRSPARILEAYIDSFEALSSTGLLQVYIQNIGYLTATYEVSVSHCSSGIDWISAKILTLDPGEQANVSFVVHSFNSLGQINNCESNNCNAINFDYNV